MPRLSLIAPLLALAACGARDEAPDPVAALDAELTEGTAANAADPLVATALADGLMSDPQLRASANADAVRPPAQPYAAPIPSPDLAGGDAGANDATTPAPTPASDCRDCRTARDSVTLGALAARQAARVTGDCASRLRYSAGWANRLPRDLPLHPAARVVEAAGANDAGCTLRVVSFTVAQPMAGVIDWYYTRATRAGYSAEHRAEDGQHMLGGARGRDGGAYLMFLAERPGGGTAIDLVANRGV